MVTKIISGKNIRGLLLYNENKVNDGNAQLILASSFGTELDKLDFSAKLTRFEHLTFLKPNVKTNALHIMLNFDRMDNLGITKLQQIAGIYMERIGFGDQPFLVYKHEDVSHPHLHIVTTNINHNSERIDIHGIGWKLSETARKELENEFGLVKAEGRNKSEALAISPIDIEKVIYGKAPTKRAINNVVSAVMRTYKFTSLAEYNAILKQFNIVADRGKEDTLMFEKRGLVYSMIDADGKRVGIPFKASSLTNRPTLEKVEKKFDLSREIRKTFKKNIVERLENIMGRYDTIMLDTFRKELEKQKIDLILRTNEQGFTYGLTYIDHKSRCVFNGSDLGKSYSAKLMTERFANIDRPKQYLAGQPKTDYMKKEEPEKTYLDPSQPTNFLETLISKGGYEQVPNVGRKKKRKKGKRRQIETQQGIN
jgi:hypothetical protein